ncbi:MAG: PP2C family protein-serine/threonine phosphatase [Capsulimonadaceae bacterium]
MICPTCMRKGQPGTHICDYDGARLVYDSLPDPRALPACRCGAAAGAVGADGRCGRCGVFRFDRSRDHIESAPAATIAGVSDRGRFSVENQDAFVVSQVEVDEVTYSIAVVCDGVSSSEGAGPAAQTAAALASASIESALRADHHVNLGLLSISAIRTANAGVRALPYNEDSRLDPPETTILTAIVRDNTATIAWIGDVRAYVVSYEGPQLLTRDHSWFNAVVDVGRMDFDQASASPLAYALINCLGGRISPREATSYGQIDIDPSLKIHYLTPGDRLVLCTDGFWNVQPQPAGVAELVWAGIGDDVDAAACARRLVRYAVERERSRNTTVVVIQF